DMHRDLPRLEKAELLARLAEGHGARITVVTPNRRLAQFLRAEFDRGREAQGLAAWESADILPVEAFVVRLWEDALYSELAAEMAVLLGEVQERALWQEAVGRHRPEDRLFSTEAAAAQCAEAWRLAHAWRVELHATPYWNDDARAFLEWSEHYKRVTRQGGQTDLARLPDVMAPHLGHAALRRPATLVLYGFDLLPPQLRAFLAALAAAGTTIAVTDPVPRQAKVGRVALPDARAEILSAARWARARLERNPSARIGIVVPDLARSRARVHRLFANVLQPDHLMAQGTPVMAFNISLGAPLAECPLVADALQILELAGGESPFEHASRIVRSPFIAGGESEREARARLDARLRRRCAPAVKLDALRRQCSAEKSPPAPVLVDRLERLAAVRRSGFAGTHNAAEWAKVFSEALRAIGFPGERAADSTEHQALARWHELLAEFATVERVSEALTHGGALRLLASMAAEAIFQPEAPEVPIQILGVLESAGLEFDHLWVAGLTDDAWPLPARPNPFMPVRLQRAAGIPQSDPVSSLDLDRRITQGWLRAATEVVVSHARMKDETELAPSPLIASIGEVPLESLEVAPLTLLRDAIRATGTLESIDDCAGPPLADKVLSSGGTRIFRDQAACPFRAFAHVRLASEPLETPRPGLDPRDRGTLVHCMLANVWRAIGTQAKLAAMKEDELAALLKSSADDAIAQVRRYRHDALSGRFGELEHERLLRTTREWLAIERSREDFEVVEVEQKHSLEFGGVSVNVKLDRVDRLAAGERAVLDYKTGKCTASSWLGARPEEPQLPMYALGTERVAAIAFAQVKTGEMAFKGFARAEGLLPKVGAVGRGAAKNYARWPDLLQALRVELDAIGRGFAAGDARVDPKKGKDTCGLCDQQMVCRIAERAPFGAVGGGEIDE
ncbi:MAG TPA: PD-(D/E)XK nuclease family protein, partial [Usitatibacter sp.]|nr:PD-(D/E)XK nuclease family protein [Usitatibacter sp.]